MKELAARLTEQIYNKIQNGGSNQANEIQALLENALLESFGAGYEDCQRQRDVFKD
jgi:hypothetical protein